MTLTLWVYSQYHQEQEEWVIQELIKNMELISYYIGIFKFLDNFAPL